MMPRSLHQKFQFHTGSIKSAHESFPVHEELSFNSTLVRLKVAVLKTAIGASLFQFHTGSIKRFSYLLKKAGQIPVSIPHWFD